MMKHVTAGFLLLALSGCSVFGLRGDYEAPEYDVATRLSEDIEVRRYQPRLAAEATVEAEDLDDGRNQAFRLLFDYISGENRGEARIAMTTPVETAQTAETIAMTVPVETAPGEDGQVRMRFFLPGSYDAGSAPKPLDPRVQIVSVPAQTVAVLRFSGSRSETAVAARTQDLMRALKQSAWVASSTPVAYFYDPPWTLPFFRRNEVAIPLAASSAG